MNAYSAMNSYAQVHRDANVEVASPHKLIDMLYEGALERVAQAKGAIEYNNIELRGKKINAAIAILGGLRMSLNPDQGGEIAENLDSLYIYLQTILSTAHRNADMALLDEATTLLTTMRETWNQIN